MFLSFIVPIYNVKDYLRECIDSLLNQDIDDYEIILVDDGSTDGSSEICEEYAEKSNKIKAFHKSNGGSADARNSGIRNAEGLYLGFVDGDDFIEQNCLGNIYSEIKAQKNPDLIFMKAYKYKPNHNLILLDEDYDKAQIVGCDREDVITYIAGRKKYPGSACTKLVKRELVTDNVIYFETGRIVEDLDWVKRILFAAKSFGYYDRSYYYYRQGRNESKTNSISWESYFDRVDLYDSWIDEIHSAGTKTEKEALKSFLAYEYQIMLLDYSKLSATDQKEALNWLKKNGDIINYKKSSRNRLIKVAMNIIGIIKTSQLLFLYKMRSER